MKISIIVPVYNAEKTIRRCLDSIINQTYKNIEIVIVNDGSLDSSMDICKEYVKYDDRIILINQDNRGVSSARNTGIEVSTGDYIQFVDADDEIKKNMCLEMLNTLEANELDCVICGMERNFCINNKIIKNYISIDDKIIDNVSQDDYFIEVYTANYLNAPVNKLYKSSIIKKNKILFEIGISLGEDLLFNLNYFKQVKKYAVLSKTYYVINEENNHSLTRKYNDNKIIFLEIIHKELDAYFRNLSNYEICKQYNYLFYMRSIYICLEQIINCDASINEKRKYIRKIKENQYFSDSFRTQSIRSLELLYYIFFINNVYPITYIGVKLRIFMKKNIRKIKSIKC